MFQVVFQGGNNGWKEGTVLSVPEMQTLFQKAKTMERRLGVSDRRWGTGEQMRGHCEDI